MQSRLHGRQRQVAHVLPGKRGAQHSRQRQAAAAYLAEQSLRRQVISCIPVLIKLRGLHV